MCISFIDFIDLSTRRNIEQTPREVCHWSVCLRRNKQKLSVCKRTKWTERTCPSMLRRGQGLKSYHVAEALTGLHRVDEMTCLGYTIHV